MSSDARRARAWLPVALWVVLTVAVIAAVPGLPWQRAAEQVRRSELAWLVAAILANLLILPLWTAEWRLLAPGTVRVAYARMFEVVAITAAVLNSVPFFAGEASAVALLITRAGLSRGAAVSVLAMDQLLVGLAKLAVLAAAAIYAPLPTWLRAGILSLVVGVAALLAVLVPLAHRWDMLKTRLLERPSRLREAIARAASWGAHLDAIRDARRVWRLVLLSLAKKSAELLGILAVQMAFGLEPSVAGGLLILAGLAVTTLLPVAPANLGVYEATVFASYRFLGISTETALGLAVVQHLCFLLPALATGYLTLTLRQLLPRRLRAS
jgi:hypothetical protein